MKKVIAILLVTALALSLAACGSTPPPVESAASGEEGGIQVEQELFDVVITLPADLVGETSQEELDQMQSTGVVHSAVLNEDGSITYEMSKRQHKKMMQAMDESLRAQMDSLVGSEEFPNLTAIQANEDYTHFTVTTTSQELTLEESFSVLGFYMIGGMYNALAGTPAAEITVDFVNAASGEIISTASSADLADE